jgi:hypothetical protein
MRGNPQQVWVHTGEWLAVYPGGLSQTFYFPCGANAWPVDPELRAQSAVTIARGTGIILYTDPEASWQDHTHWLFYGEGPQVQQLVNTQLRSWGYSGMVHSLRDRPTPSAPAPGCQQTPAAASLAHAKPN